MAARPPSTATRIARVEDRWSFANSIRAALFSGSSSKSRVCARSVRATGFDHALP